MKIGQPSDLTAQLAQTQSSNAQKASTTAQTAPQSTAVKSSRSAGVAVSVSTLARTMGQPGVGQISDIDTQKVATMKAAIAQGSYSVNAETIADKLLSSAQEMLPRPTPH
ncbi:MAG: flagellar biosynthesis anti-sigma factor FlgM [Rhodoferax sp.]